MVKKIVFILLCSLSVWAESPLFDKVRSLIGDQKYSRNAAFVKIIFADRGKYVNGDRIDVVSVVNTLKDNGLLSLTLNRPQTLELTFETNGTPQFFMMLMNETLRSMGYNQYITDSAQLTNAGYTWRIKMTSDSATDPTSLQKELARRGCTIFDIKRESSTQWRYFIDMSDAHLDLVPLEPGKKIRMKRLVYPRWLNVSKASSLSLWSLQGNNWYPYIAFYDDDLRLLKLYKRDQRSRQIIINLPRGCAYVKIADLYSRKNMNAGLSVQAQ